MSTEEAGSVMSDSPSPDARSISGRIRATAASNSCRISSPRSAMAVRSFGTAHSAVEADWPYLHAAHDARPTIAW